MRTRSIRNAVFATLLLFCLLIGTLSISAKEDSLLEPPDTAMAKAAYLYNFESDRAIVNQNPLIRISPASTVKIATGLLAIEHLSDRLDEIITVEPHMLLPTGGTVIGLRAGDRLSIRDLLYASLCGGYNDATNILACLVSGSVTAFVQQLNDRVMTWGCQETHYTNPTGMDESDMYTILDDVIVLSKRAIQTPLYMTVTSAISYSFSLQNREETMLIYNRNALISPYYYQGCQSKYAKGLIAGMTDGGGYCVATYAEYAGSRYLCIVMGALGNSQGIPNSFALAYRLLQYAYLNCVYIPIANAGDVICEATVRLALPKDKEGVATVPCVLRNDLHALLPKDTTAEDLSFRSYLHQDVLEAPVKAGQVLGGVDVYYGDTWVCHAKLVAAEEVQPNTILITLDNMKQVFFSRAGIISVIAFVLLTALYLLCERHRRRKNTTRLDFRVSHNQKPPKPPRS